MHNLYTAAGAVFYHKVVAPEGTKGGVETPSPKLMERKANYPRRWCCGPRGSLTHVYAATERKGSHFTDYSAWWMAIPGIISDAHRNISRKQLHHGQVVLRSHIQMFKARRSASLGVWLPMSFAEVLTNLMNCMSHYHYTTRIV